MPGVHNMPIVVAFISQKGGVGKSTLARALAAVAAHGGLRVAMLDLDPQQATVSHWARARRENKVAPAIAVALHESLEDALAAAPDADLVIVDAPARASRATLELARRAQVIVQPSGASLDDLYPAVLLFHELVQAGIPRQRLAMALCRLLTDEEEKAARLYGEEAGYAVLPGFVPERAAFRNALNRGQALTETGKRDHSADTDRLIEALLDRIADELAERAASESGQRKGGAA
jgi:chromosome partitioning protein